MFPPRKNYAAETNPQPAAQPAPYVMPSTHTSPDPTSREIMRLEGKLHLLQEENNFLRAKAKANSKTAGIIEALQETLRDSIKPLAPVEPPQLDTRSGMCVEDVVMHLSDEHADQIVLPHRVGNLENYNFQVALARAERYVERTIDFTKRHLDKHSFENLWILAYGDHVNGTIHGGTEQSAMKDPMLNAVAVGQMHGLMFRDLAAHFRQVNVIYVPGNHGRTTAKKDYKNSRANWDQLVANTAFLTLQDQSNVQITVPDSYSAIVNIRGYNFMISHGDDIRAWNGLPLYSIDRKTRRVESLHSRQNIPIHYHCMGHFHQPATMTQNSGEVILNGSWKAIDEYCYNALGAYTEPAQWIHGVHAEQGVSWRVKVGLKFDGDINGPRRYAVSLASAA